MKFKIVVWMLGFMLERASKNNPRVQRKLAGQDLIFEIGCADGYARHFVIKDQQILSYPGRAREPVYLGPSQEPTFALTFDSPETGVKALTAKDRQLVMISGLHEGRITIEGNPLYMMWFQSLAKLMDAK